MAYSFEEGYTHYYEIPDVKTSTKVQEVLFKQGFIWCGTGAGIWHSKTYPCLYTVNFGQRKISYTAGTDNIVRSKKTKKQLFLEAQQMEFYFA